MPYKGFFRFLEDKSHLINKLNMSLDQKIEVEEFFKAHPNYENKIDWNNRKLTYEDFKPILELEGKSKNSQKKYGLSGKAQIEDLEEGKDYQIVKVSDSSVNGVPDFILYKVLTFKGSEVLAKPSTPPEGVTGKWCIAGRNYSPGTRDQHWNDYTEQGIEFYFYFTPDTKYAFSVSPEQRGKSLRQRVNIYDEGDISISEEEFDDDLGDGSFKEVLLALGYHPLSANHTITIEEVNGQFIPPNYAKGEDELRNLVIEDGIKEIEQFAFGDCTGLSSVKIPDSVNTIGEGAFSGCSFLETLHFPDGLHYLAPYICQDDLQLEDLHLPKYLWSIGACAFSGCGRLKEIEIPNGVNSIGMYAFTKCWQLKKITFPETLERIERGAFQDTALKSVRIPGKVKSIMPYAFYNCRDLKEVIIDQPWNTENRDWSGLAMIGEGAFAGDKELVKISIPEGYQAIGGNAFSECWFLNEITLPSTMKYLDPYALPWVNTIHFKGTREQWNTVFIDSCAFIESKDHAVREIQSIQEEPGGLLITIEKRT